MITFNSLDQNLKFIDQKKKEGYKFCIYGAGKNCEYEMKICRNFESTIKIDFIVDADIKKKGSFVNGYEIIHTDDLMKLNENYIIFYSLQNLKYTKEIENLFIDKCILVKNYKIPRNINELLEKRIKDDEDLRKYYNSIQRIDDNEIFLDNIEYVYRDGQVYMLDLKSERINIVNGCRVTENFTQSKNDFVNIKFFGDSRFFNGLYDKYTIASFLQEKVGDSFKVENHSIRAQHIWNIQKQILNNEFCENDIVIINSTISKYPDYNVYNDLNCEELAILYMQPIFQIKRYLDSIGAKLIFVWTSHIKEKKTHGRFEKEILKIIENLDVLVYPEFGKVDEGTLRIYPKVDEISKICNISGITFLDSVKLFSKNNYDAFMNPTHYTTIAHEAIADELSELIRTMTKFNENEEIKKYNKKAKLYTNNYAFQYYFSNGPIMNYLTDLEKISKNKPNNAGAIVVNANPFTKGHLYLIETAIKQVDFLYVFVVEEDKSYFKFEDRFELVRKGLSHLSNVIVIPSGKAIISSITMPEYFEKESQVNQKLDASTDIAMFGNLISPICKIKKRFVGSEPFCKITAQYNNQLKEQLNEFDIELVEIDRISIKSENDIISATKVREYLKCGDEESLRKYVPESTMNFLIKEYFKS